LITQDMSPLNIVLHSVLLAVAGANLL